MRLTAEQDAAPTGTSLAAGSASTLTAPTEPPTVSVSVEMEADPHEVYALLVDLDSMAELTEETEAMTWSDPTAGAAVGAAFEGQNRHGRRTWSTTCTVTDADPSQRFAFEVSALGGRVPVARWQYDLCWSTSGCRVTESTWDRRPRWFRAPATLVTGVRDRTEASRRHIEATLARVRDHVEQP